MPVSRYQFCCGCLPIFSGIFAIVLHSFVHSIYGMCLILTSYYSPPNDVVNYIAVSGYVLLILLGLPILWVVMFQQLRGIKFMGSLLVILTLFNLSCGIAYFVVYFQFKANSLLDKVFLWRHGTKWVTSEQHPFAIWHFLTGLLVLPIPIWFYYSYVIFTYVNYVMLLETTDDHIPEIVIIENRMGPFGYRPPDGYPYSANQQPQFVPPEGQYVSIYQPARNPPRQPDNAPRSILD